MWGRLVAGEFAQYFRRLLWSVARHEKYVSESGLRANTFAAKFSNGIPSNVSEEIGHVSKNAGRS